MRENVESTKFIDDRRTIIYIRNDNIPFLTILDNGFVDFDSWKLHYLHRKDGPAVEWVSGEKWWMENGCRHRIDGQAVEWSTGSKEWYLDGKLMEFETWKREVRKYYDTEEDYLLMLLKL